MRAPPAALCLGPAEFGFEHSGNQQRRYLVPDKLDLEHFDNHRQLLHYPRSGSFADSDFEAQNSIVVAGSGAGVELKERDSVSIVDRERQEIHF